MVFLENYMLEINGVKHTLDFTYRNGKYSVFVDSALVETFKPPSYFSVILGDLNDYRYKLDGCEIIFAVRFNKARVAANGKYVDSGLPFKPVLDLPVWAYSFVAAIIIPILALRGEFIDIIIGILAGFTCTHFIIKNPDLKADMRRKIIYCVLLVIVFWIYFGVLYFFMRKSG